MSSTVAVTGATGFIGSHGVRLLAQAGHRLRVLVRDPARLREAPPELEVVLGSLQDAGALDRLMQGADAAVHIAGAVAAGDRAEFRSANVDGTAATLAAARTAGVRRFVHVSSLAARAPHLSAYAASKRAAEGLFAADTGLSWVILRPPAVYGPGDRATLPLIRQLSGSRAFVPATSGARLSLIHVEDLARALVVLATGEAPAGSVHELHDGKRDGYSWGELAREAGRAQSRAVQVSLLPRAVLELAAFGSERWVSLSGGRSMLTRDKVRELYHSDWVAREALLEQHCSWQPQISFAEGFVETLRWYREQGWLPGGGATARSRIQSRRGQEAA